MLIVNQLPASYNVVVSSFHTGPRLQKINFNEEETVRAGHPVNFTVQIISILPLEGDPEWSRGNDALLPEDSHISNYLKYGNNYTTLIIDKVTCNDSGIYMLSVSNDVGASTTIFVTLDVYKGKHTVE